MEKDKDLNVEEWLPSREREKKNNNIIKVHPFRTKRYSKFSNRSQNFIKQCALRKWVEKVEPVWVWRPSIRSLKTTGYPPTDPCNDRRDYLGSLKQRHKTECEAFIDQVFLQSLRSCRSSRSKCRLFKLRFLAFKIKSKIIDCAFQAGFSIIH